MLSTMSSQQTSAYFPALSCVIAAILWGVLWYPLRLLESMGLPGLWSALLIYCSAFVFIIPACWKKRSEILKHKQEYLLIGLFAGWTNLAFILAMLEGEVVRVLMLFYLSPIWAILLAVVILKERLTLTSLIALGLALMGGVLMLWNPEQYGNDGVKIADVFAITSGMAFAMTNIMVRKVGDVPMSIKISSAWAGVIMITVACLLIVQSPVPEISTNAATLACLLGFPFMLVMTWTALYGVTHLPIQRSSVIFLLEIVAGTISAAFLTEEVVSYIEYIGGVLIIFAGLVSVWQKKETNAEY